MKWDLMCSWSSTRNLSFFLRHFGRSPLAEGKTRVRGISKTICTEPCWDRAQLSTLRPFLPISNSRTKSPEKQCNNSYIPLLHQARSDFTSPTLLHRRCPNHSTMCRTCDHETILKTLVRSSILPMDPNILVLHVEV